jgi:hypothetical protein
MPQRGLATFELAIAMHRGPVAMAGPEVFLAAFTKGSFA